MHYLEAAAAAVRTGAGSRTDTRARVRAKSELTVLRPGWAVPSDVWNGMHLTDRHAARVHATSRVLSAPGTVFSHYSAAVLHDLPLARAGRLDRVHVTGGAVNGVVGSAARYVCRHDMHLDERDTTVVHGLRCTTLERTIFDLACSASLECAISAADGAFRKVAGGATADDHDVAAEEALRGGLRRRVAARAGARGIRQARFVVSFADGRAQLPGESISRLYLLHLGFATPRLQVKVPGRGSGWYHIDFGLDDVGAWGEFDGRGKYLTSGDAAQNVADTVMAEKEREDWIRAVTGRPVARWGWEDLASPSSLRARLARYSIRPNRPAL